MQLVRLQESVFIFRCITVRWIDRLVRAHEGRCVRQRRGGHVRGCLGRSATLTTPQAEFLTKEGGVYANDHSQSL